MKKLLLSSGLTIVIEQKPIETITIQATVKVGSNNEIQSNNGISHFIEHMLFEGTKKRADSMAITNEIESIGGELNAYTSNERTSFYIRVPKFHFNKALDIMTDMVFNSVFDPQKVEKERKVILKEINLHKDEPRFHQWVLFSKALFKDHPAGRPAYGTIQAVNHITRDDLFDYYNHFYTPKNIVISLVGDIGGVHINAIKTNLDIKKPLALYRQIPAPKTPKKSIVKESRRILSSYLVLGYRTPSRLDKDSYVLDVIKSILGRGQSGKIFDEIRNKHGLAYEVGVHHDPQSNYGFIAVYINTSKANLKKVISIILEQFSRLKDISEKELKEAKGFLIGQHILHSEDPKDLADSLGFWQTIKDASLFKDYLKEINRVTKADVINVAQKYLTKDYALGLVIEK